MGISLLVSIYAMTAYMASALSVVEKKNKERRILDYARNNLQSEQFQVVLIASPDTVPAPEVKNIDGYDKVLSKAARDRLRQFGVPTLYAHPHYVIPTYAPWDNPEDKSANPYPIGERMIFVIENKALRERMDNAEFQQFFRDATAKHATFIITGESGLESFHQLTEKAEVRTPVFSMFQGNGPMFAFKRTHEKDASGADIDIADFGPPIHSLNGNTPLDQALFIIEFSRGESEGAKRILLQWLPA